MTDTSTAARDQPIPVDVPKSELGEGPVWDGPSQSLVWVDITGRFVHRYWPADGRVSSHRTPTPVGSVCLSESGAFTLALEDGFWTATERFEALRPLAIVHQTGSGLRFNDGKCDPAGRFWAGSMAYQSEPGLGALYRLDPGSTATRVLGGIGISNGLDWSQDGRSFYYIDTLSQTVAVFDFDRSSGDISSGRGLIRVDPDDGHPDGLTVDAEGFLWLALWNGWSIRRYAPDGRLDRVVHLPVAKVSSCAFGGPDLGDLYITTAAYDLSDADRRSQPLAGSLFVFRPGVIGRPSVRRRDGDYEPSQAVAGASQASRAAVRARSDVSARVTISSSPSWRVIAVRKIVQSPSMPTSMGGSPCRNSWAIELADRPRLGSRSKRARGVPVPASPGNTLRTERCGIAPRSATQRSTVACSAANMASWSSSRKRSSATSTPTRSSLETFIGRPRR